MIAEKSKQWLRNVSQLLLLVMLAASLLEPLAPKAYAEQLIQLGVTAGIGGEYRGSDMIPVQVTVTNGGTADVEGNVVIAIGNGSDIFTAAYYQPVSVAKGARKQVTILAPGDEIGPNTFVALQQNGAIIAKTSIGGRRYNQETLMVGVLAADPDTANFLGTMPKTKFAEQVRVLPMKAEQVPQTAMQMGMLNMLVINDFALDSMTETQIAAIKDWTKNGGMLILAGGATYAKSAGKLAELSPVAVNGVGSTSKLSGLAVEKEKPIELATPFTISNGTIQDGRALISEGNQPIMAVRNVGEGKVLYVAYDLAQEPVASWSGNSRLWGDLLNKAFGKTLYKRMENPGYDIWPLKEASDRIPALKLPEVPWLGLYFAIYAFLVGPIFYFLLRMKRKQSYMWAVVPAFAIVAGIGIFAYGAIQRGSGVILHSSGYLQFNQAGQAKSTEVASIFVPRSADYETVVKGSGRVWPIINRRGDEEPKTWLSTQSDRTTTQFRDVEFWAVRKLGMAKDISDAGSFVSDLSYNNGKLSGTVTNNTKYALHDVRIIAGQTIQTIANVAAGASVQVDLSFNAQAQITPGRRMYSNKKALIPQAVQSNLNADDSREWAMIDILEEGRPSAPDYSNGVMLLGWSDQPINDVEIKDETVRAEHLTLVTAPLSIKPSPDGTVFYPAGTFKAIMTESTASETDEMDDGFQMRAGEITFEFQLEEENQKLQVSKLYMYTWSQDKTLFDKQVYNWQTKAFVPFDQAFANNLLTTDKIGTFLSPDGVLRVKFSHSMDEYRHIGTPVIGVEGKLVKP